MDLLFLFVTQSFLTRYINSLDGLANNIASATFEVINEGKIRTQDMGGEYMSDVRLYVWTPLTFNSVGAATTSEFTAAIIKKLQA
jgi:isocitrate dehydrogenase (NAD+)